MSENFDHVKSYKNRINDGSTIVSIWSIEDVICRAKDRNISITDEDAKDVLIGIKQGFDASIGINWDVIDSHLDNLQYK